MGARAGGSRGRRQQGERTYRIQRCIGAGGFGRVYQAELTAGAGFTRQVALKVLRYSGEAEDDVAARFRDEARLLGRLRHRAIVQVDALSMIGGELVAVMEFIEGADLEWFVERGPVPLSVVMEVVGEVANALDAAWHTRGPGGLPLAILHRDIKPANIRLSPRGEVKLLDFGIAQSALPGREASSP